MSCFLMRLRLSSDIFCLNSGSLRILVNFLAMVKGSPGSQR